MPYYLITFTVPQQLRRIIGSNQKVFYALLLRQSAAALLEVGRDHKDLGAELAVLAVLQTWTRDLRFHPHVHCVVPAGGLSPDGLRWVRPKRPNYFLPQAALAMRLRTRLKEALQQDHAQLFNQIDRQVWSIDWVADVQAVGSGEPALKYLAAYVYRTAFSAQRILERRRPTHHLQLSRRQRPEHSHGAPVAREIPASVPSARFAKGLSARASFWMVKPGGQIQVRARRRLAGLENSGLDGAHTLAGAALSLLPKTDALDRTVAARAAVKPLMKSNSLTAATKRRVQSFPRCEGSLLFCRVGLKAKTGFADSELVPGYPRTISTLLPGALQFNIPSLQRAKGRFRTWRRSKAKDKRVQPGWFNT